MNISEHVGKLRKYMEFRNYSCQSVKNYCSCFAGFLTHFDKLCVTHPDRINADMVIEFLSRFTEPATHSGYHSAIKIYYEHVARVGIEKFKFIERPKRSKKLPIVLSPDEIQRMFDVCDNLKHRVVLALLYSCGLRAGELINLKWKHIDRSRMIINVIAGKGNKDRQVMLSEALIPLLEDYYRQYRSREFVLNGWKDEIQYSKRSVLEVMKQLAAKAGIDNKRVYTHLIRHCSFTHMVEHGTDINLIQRIAGHSSVKTTMMYCHISNNVISSIQSPLSRMRI